jgi:hypothetical protein
MAGPASPAQWFCSGAVAYRDSGRFAKTTSILLVRDPLNRPGFRQTALILLGFPRL